MHSDCFQFLAATNNEVINSSICLLLFPWVRYSGEVALGWTSIAKLLAKKTLQLQPWWLRQHVPSHSHKQSSSFSFCQPAGYNVQFAFPELLANCNIFILFLVHLDLLFYDIFISVSCVHASLESYDLFCFILVNL